MKRLLTAFAGLLLVPSGALAQSFFEAAEPTLYGGALGEAEPGYPTLRIADEAAAMASTPTWLFTPSSARLAGIDRRTAEPDGSNRPVLLIDWQFSDTIALDTIATAGGETNVRASYAVNDTIVLGLGAGLDVFTLSGRAEGYDGQDSSRPRQTVPLFAAATFTPNPFLSLSVTGGVSFDARLSEGGEVDNAGSEGSGEGEPFLGLSGSLRF